MSANRALLVALAVLAVPAFAAGQGLGDAAARERERRAKTEPKREESPKVYSNADLITSRPAGQRTATEADAGDESRPTRSQGAAQEGGVPQAAAGAAAAQEPSASELLEQRARREREFEAAIEAARERVVELERRMTELMQRLNPASTTFIYGPGGTLDLTEEGRIRAELKDMPGRIEAARRLVTVAEDALVDFRNGRTDVVPGGRPVPPQ